MKSYTYRELLELRVRLPYGSIQPLADELGYKHHTSISQLFSKPIRWDADLYKKVEDFIISYSILKAEKIGIIIDKDADYCHESAKKYLSGLTTFINYKDYKSLSLAKQNRIMDEFKKIKRQVDHSTESIYLTEN